MELTCPECGKRDFFYMDDNGPHGDAQFYMCCCDAHADITQDEVDDFWRDYP